MNWSFLFSQECKYSPNVAWRNSVITPAVRHVPTLRRSKVRYLRSMLLQVSSTYLLVYWLVSYKINVWWVIYYLWNYSRSYKTTCVPFQTDHLMLLLCSFRYWDSHDCYLFMSPRRTLLCKTINFNYFQIKVGGFFSIIHKICHTIFI